MLSGTGPRLRRFAVVLPVALAACTGPIQILEKESEGRYVDAYERPAEFFTKLSDENRTIGIAMARSEGYGLAPAPEINEYLNEVLARIVAVSPVPNAPVRVILKADQNFGVEATQDGLILINAGTLLSESLATEDQLAAMMSHELAHIYYQHHQTDRYEKIGRVLTQLSNLGDNAVSALSKTEFGNSEATNYILIATELTENVIAPNVFNKDQEDDADRFGTDLLVAAGYNIDAVFQTLQLAQAQQELVRQTNQSRRDADVQGAAGKVKEEVDEGDVGGTIGSILKTGKTVAKNLKDTIFEKTGSNYYAKRESRLRDYIAREYRYIERPEPATLPWLSQRSGSMVSTLNNYRAAGKALAAQNDGKLDEAEGYIRTAVGWPTETDSYPRLVFSNIREAQGLPEKALENLRIATKSDEPALRVYLRLVLNELGQGRLVEAGKLLETASAEIGDPPHLLPTRIRYHKLSGEDLEARSLVLNCKTAYPRLAAQCEREFSEAAALAKGGVGPSALDVKSVEAIEDQIDNAGPTKFSN